MTTVRLLHASDLHVGDIHVDKGDPVTPLVDAAIAEGVDALLLVGDIFDHNRVPTEVGQQLADELARLDVPVIVLPGNHDCLVPDAVWRRVDLPPNVHLMTDAEGHHVEPDDLDVSFWGRPHPTYNDIKPLHGLPPRSGRRTWDVVLAHGHMVLRPEDLHRAYQITPDEIAASDRDYVALGHWDVPHDMSAGDVTAHYSGSASRFGVCALVTMTIEGDERRVEATRFELAMDPTRGW